MSLSSSPLLTAADMTAFGYSAVADAVLMRVSSKVRRYTGQTIGAATSTASGRSPLVLPQYPVNSVASVVTAAGTAVSADDWFLRGNVITAPVCPGINDFEINYGPYPAAAREKYGWITVQYASGWATLPDELLELLCSIAARVAAGAGTAEAGLRTRTVGGESLTFAAEAISLDLTDREQAQLDGFFPNLRSGPRTTQLVAPWS